jgi:hypothetical protein
VKAGVQSACRFSLIRTIFREITSLLVGAKTMGFSRRRRLMQGEIRDY